MQLGPTKCPPPATGRRFDPISSSSSSVILRQSLAAVPWTCGSEACGPDTESLESQQDPQGELGNACPSTVWAALLVSSRVTLLACDSKILRELLKAPTKIPVIFLLLSLFNTSISSYYLFACLIIRQTFSFLHNTR